MSAASKILRVYLQELSKSIIPADVMEVRPFTNNFLRGTFLSLKKCSPSSVTSFAKEMSRKVRF